MDRRVVLNQVLEILRAENAEGDAYLVERESLSLRVREGRLEEISRAGVRGLAVRAMVDQRLGFVHTSAVGEEGARDAARKALALAKSASPRTDLVIPEPVGPGDGRDEGEALAIYDSSIEEKPISEKEGWARSAEAIARGHDPKIRGTEGASYDEDLTSIWIANTKGLFRHCRLSGIDVGVEVVAEEADEKQIGDAGVEVTRWENLPDPGELGRRAAERAVRLIGGRPVPTGRYPVIFSPDAGWAPLVYVSVALRGDHLSRKRSWLTDRLDTQIGSRFVTIRDDARKVGGPASLPFDAEGVDTGEITLVDQGKVAGTLLDLASAKRLAKESTGSSRREGYAQLPEISSSNLYLAPGDTKPEQLFDGVEQGLWVWGLSGWWVGLDPSNPDFSSAAFGLWIEDGKPTKPVARVTIAGTIEEILGGVDAVADDLVWDHPTKAPTYRVAEMAVSGT